MHLLSKRSILALITGIVTASAGVFYFLLRRRPAPPLPITETETVEVEPAVSSSTALEPILEPTRSFSPILVLLTASGGFACLVAAQNAMLRSAWPLTPLMLYLVGFLLLIPLCIYWAREWSAEALTPDTSLEDIDTKTSSTDKRLYLLGIAFFTILGIVLAQTGILSPLLLFTSLMNGLLLAGMLNLIKRPSIQQLQTGLQNHRLEIAGLLILMLLTAWAYSRMSLPGIPPPQSPELNPSVRLIYTQEAGPLYRYLESLFAQDANALRILSTIFALLLIPSTYLVAQIIGGKLTGFFAAVLVAIAEWTLALGQSGGVYPALGVCSALFLFTLLRAMRNNTRTAYLWAGFTLAFGWLISPLFIAMALLLPISLLLNWRIERTPLRGLLRNLIAVGVATGIIVLPFITAPRPVTPASLEPVYRTGLSASTLFTEGLSRSLLMFNLTSDPNIQHGLPNRPVFAPALAAAFVSGCLLWAVWLANRSQAHDWLLIIALVICLIPSALVTDPLANAPDLQRAALAIPVAITLAAFGLNTLAQLLPKFKNP